MLTMNLLKIILIKINLWIKRVKENRIRKVSKMKVVMMVKTKRKAKMKLLPVNVSH